MFDEREACYRDGRLPRRLAEYLTVRRVEILREAGCGYGPAEIAKRLNLTPGNLRTRTHDLRRQLDCEDDVALGRWWQQNQILWLEAMREASGATHLPRRLPAGTVPRSTVLFITMRRAEMLRELSDGYSTAEIAGRLRIEQSGVRTSILELRRTLGCNNRGHLARWWRSGRAAWLHVLSEAGGSQTAQPEYRHRGVDQHGHSGSRYPTRQRARVTPDQERVSRIHGRWPQRT